MKTSILHGQSNAYYKKSNCPPVNVDLRNSKIVILQYPARVSMDTPKDNHILDDLKEGSQKYDSIISQFGEILEEIGQTPKIQKP